MSPHHEPQHGGGQHAHGGCHFRPEVLAVAPVSRDSAIAFLNEQGIEAEDATESILSEFLDLGSVQDGAGQPPIGVLGISVDPHEAADVLAFREEPILASPIHGLGYEGHGRFMSGEGPSRDGFELDDPDMTDPQGWIAVIDSGLVAEDRRPHWMRETHVEDFSLDPEVVEEPGASHGTFVTSVIRMVAPEFGVAFAAAPPDSGGILAGSTVGEVSDPPTSELDVLGAVSRLILGLAHRPGSVVALNLSLGAPRCGANDGFLLTLKSALRLWRINFGVEATVFAAGGNANMAVPVYPAAFPGVRGVGAGIDGATQQQVWDDSGTGVTANHRFWIDDVAPGLALLGAGGLDELDVVKWSGSSFSSAVAAASYAKRAPYVVHDGVVYWGGRPMNYATVEGVRPA